MNHGFMNLYHSGFYHRRGKPGAVDAHGGDVYLSYAEAVSQAEPDRGYFATVAIHWDGPALESNPTDSVPVPLSISRKAFQGVQA